MNTNVPRTRRSLRAEYRAHERKLYDAFIPWVLDFHGGYLDTLICPEFAVGHGSGYADIAVIDHAGFYGYELKSGADSLARLEIQRRYYGEIFDHATLVCDPKHMAKAEDLLPSWWGLILARTEGTRIVFDEWRVQRQNPAPDVRERVTLLWRAEALALVDRFLTPHKLKYAPRSVLYTHLVQGLPNTLLSDHVRRALRERASTQPNQGRTIADWRKELEAGK